MGRVAELVIGWSDLVEQEDLASSPGAGRDREQAVLGIDELVDPRATSVKDGRWSLNAEIGDEEGTGVVSVGESPIVFERDSRDAGEVAHREVTVQGALALSAQRYLRANDLCASVVRASDFSGPRPLGVHGRRHLRARDVLL